MYRYRTRYGIGRAEPEHASTTPGLPVERV